MWEELSPESNRRGLYDGLASVLGEYARQINLVQIAQVEGVCECFVAQKALMEAVFCGLLRDIAIILHADNPYFNEFRFRKQVFPEKYLQEPGETRKKATKAGDLPAINALQTPCGKHEMPAHACECACRECKQRQTPPV